MGKTKPVRKSPHFLKYEFYETKMPLWLVSIQRRATMKSAAIFFASPSKRRPGDAMGEAARRRCEGKARAGDDRKTGEAGAG